MTTKILRIRQDLWADLLNRLQKKSTDQTESGAFLLGPINKNKITHIICYDDLDPRCRDSGYINFNTEKYVELWKICAESNLCVLADIHTHPSEWVEQSSIDSTHPMISQPGHIALILPNFGKDGRHYKKIGVYEYLGNHEWKKFKYLSNKIKITWL